MNSNKTAQIVDGTDKLIKRKRLKVVSACGGCRRKKTKCNGERPCATCIKADIECIYVNNYKINQANNSASQRSRNNEAGVAQPSPPLVTSTVLSAYSNTSAYNASIAQQTRIADDHHHASILTIKPTTANSILDSYRYSSANSNNNYIQSIEERLCAIENILRAMISSSNSEFRFFDSQHQQFQQKQTNTCSTLTTSVTLPTTNKALATHPKFLDSNAYTLHHGNDSSSNKVVPSCETAPRVHVSYAQKRQRPTEDEDYNPNEYEQRRTRHGDYHKRTIQEDSGHGYHDEYYQQYHHRQQQMLSDLPSSSSAAQRSTATSSMTASSSDYRLPPLQPSNHESSSSPSSTTSSRMPAAIRNLLNDDSGDSNKLSLFSQPKIKVFRDMSSVRTTITTATTNNNNSSVRESLRTGSHSPTATTLQLSSSDEASKYNQHHYDESSSTDGTTAKRSIQENAKSRTTMKQHTSAFLRITPNSAFPNDLINNNNNNNSATTAAGTF
ncbi:hypothetical protein BDF20DRAFT_834981 [Mycotypha africana]|uniref:uncharacterized protein n=1 Tax=Mycotypha africana TaxID=64632 RepID=UPI0023012705|nr:uncharacterized protein BDF20DRAFT_834981 [Mycotypha africana]KAI8982352.1 hypothetical protein BDF20DRAFT_834981 [Mycotypha africana]